MAYIISVYFFLLEFISKRKKLSIGLLIIFLFILGSGNYDNADLNNYYTRYENLNNTGLEAGWGFLTKVFSSLGFDFLLFKAVLILILLILVYKSAKFYHADVYSVFLCYLFFPFIWDIIQLRNTIVMMLLMAAFTYLLQCGWKNALKYLILIGIASLFHQVALWYILFLPAKFVKNKKPLAFLCILCTVIGCFFIYTGIIDEVITIIINRERVLDYLTSKAGLGVIVGWMRIILPVFVFLIFYKRYQNIKDNRKILIKKRIVDKAKIIDKYISVDYSEFADLIYKINFINLMVCVLTCYNAMFFRIVRNVLLLNIIFIVHVIDIDVKFKKNTLLNTIFAVISFIIIAGVDYMANIQGTFFAIMENNIFF
ncbi:UNVERIFIED_ORG: hypothetical protein B5F06_09710 [Lacrimispora saccharolytica]